MTLWHENQNLFRVIGRLNESVMQSWDSFCVITIIIIIIIIIIMIFIIIITIIIISIIIIIIIEETVDLLVIWNGRCSSDASVMT